MPTDVIILMGPKGTGKSHLANLIMHQGGTWFNNEQFFLDLYKEDHRAFQEDRDNAYKLIEKAIRESIRTAPNKPVIFEETARSAQAQQLIRNLQSDYAVMLIKVGARMDISIRRAVKRGTDTNFLVTDEVVKESHRVFESETAKQFTFAGVIDNSDSTEEELVVQICRILTDNCADKATTRSPLSRTQGEGLGWG